MCGVIGCHNGDRAFTGGRGTAEMLNVKCGGERTILHDLFKFPGHSCRFNVVYNFLSLESDFIFTYEHKYF